jgi:hypothetical protein
MAGQGDNDGDMATLQDSMWTLVPHHQAHVIHVSKDDMSTKIKAFF